MVYSYIYAYLASNLPNYLETPYPSIPDATDSKNYVAIDHRQSI